MLKNILIGCGVLLGFIVVGMFLANRDAANRYYDLSIVNTTADHAHVMVSQTSQMFDVDPNSAKTFRIEGQKDADANTPRSFHIQAGTIDESVDSSITYSSNVILDVSGKSCVLAVDYGAQYRGPDVQLPEGVSDIKIAQVIKDQRISTAPSFKAADGGYEVSAATKLGEKLPEKIEAKNGAMPTHGRIINVPCELLDNDAALYDYLNAN